MIDVNVIATGSSGNGVLVDGRILIDCGVSYRKIEPCVPDLKLVLLTHAHTDHFRKGTIRRLGKERPSLRFACGEWMVPLLLMEKIPPRQIDVIPDRKWMNYSNLGIQVMRQLVPHDVINCCWHLSINGEKALYVTDAGNLSGISAQAYSLYMIEANRSRAELELAIEAKRKAGEFIYEHRVVGTHLFKEQADAFLAQNMDENSEYIYLHAHKDRTAAQ